MNDKSISYVTSGGYAHYSNKSIAYSYIDKKFISNDENLKIEINGNFYNCKIINEPLYDPKGLKMKS